jgi:hypothetical protein
MTDSRMTKLCADAMGIPVVSVAGRWYIGSYWEDGYNPLQLDDQAMALVKKLGLNIGRLESGWEVRSDNTLVTNADLNRAIVECSTYTQLRLEGKWPIYGPETR